MLACVPHTVAGMAPLFTVLWELSCRFDCDFWRDGSMSGTTRPLCFFWASKIWSSLLQISGVNVGHILYIQTSCLQALLYLCLGSDITAPPRESMLYCNTFLRRCLGQLLCMSRLTRLHPSHAETMQKSASHYICTEVLVLPLLLT